MIILPDTAQQRGAGNEMLTKYVFEALCILIACTLNGVKAAHIIKAPRGSYNLDITGCGPIEKKCQPFEDGLAILSCAINSSHNNKSQAPFTCQHKIWSHQAELLDNTLLDDKLREPCQDEPTILECLKPQEYGIDCVLKKKPIVKNKICWRMINKIESIIFNDWQITNNFLKNCFDDIQVHTCGRIPPDPRALSQTQTLKCLQGKEQLLKPECQSEIGVLNEMKYSSLALDKLVFAACHVDQSKLCPDEVPATWLMYKCLLHHKYEDSK